MLSHAADNVHGDWLWLHKLVGLSQEKNRTHECFLHMALRPLKAGQSAHQQGHLVHNSLEKNKTLIFGVSETILSQALCRHQLSVIAAVAGRLRSSQMLGSW